MEAPIHTKTTSSCLEGLEVASSAQADLKPVSVAELRDATVMESIGKMAATMMSSLAELPGTLLSFRKQGAYSAVLERFEDAKELRHRGEIREALEVLNEVRGLTSSEMKLHDFLTVEINKEIGALALYAGQVDESIQAYASAIKGMEASVAFETYETAQAYASLGHALGVSGSKEVADAVFRYAEHLIEDALLIPVAPDLCCDAATDVFNKVAQFHLENGDTALAQQALSNALSAIYRTMGLLSPKSPKIEAQIARVSELADIHNVEELTMEAPVLRLTVKLTEKSVGQVIQYRTDQKWH
jgi:tetratricopeptide (TPR) repeat protein